MINMNKMLKREKIRNCKAYFQYFCIMNIIIFVENVFVFFVMLVFVFQISCCQILCVVVYVLFLFYCMYINGSRFCFEEKTLFIKDAKL